jgi:secreted trypsin-like serine protease
MRNSAGVGVEITSNSDGETEYGEFPWIVAITRREAANDSFINVYMCGASLITENIVMTAAHCVNGEDIDAMRIRVGEWDIQTTFELFPHSDHEVEKVVIHEKFNKGGLHNDIALLFLKTNVEMSEVVNTICLPSQDQPFDGKRCFATGWGKKGESILKKIELPTVPRDKCQANLRKTRLGRRFILHESFMCAGGEEGRDTCRGDGGSPLVCPVDGVPDKYYQAGIVAWGVGCGQKDVPGVYANVAYFRNWIDQQISSNIRP